MKVWIKFIIILIVCIGAVFGVYVWRFGMPKFLNKEGKALEAIYDIVQEQLKMENVQNIEATLEDSKISFTLSKENEKKQNIEFERQGSIISAIIDENIIDDSFADKAISNIFVAVAKNRGYDESNARYSIISDIVKAKTLEQDGFQITSINGVTRFMIYMDKKLNLADKDEVYIKSSDIASIRDIFKNRLEYRLIEKPGIVMEKNISYSDYLVFVIYEEGILSKRTYDSLMTLLNEMVGEQLVQYVKSNYSQITRNGTLTLNNITISLNEKLGEGNVHYYLKPENYEYMLVRINKDIIK